MFKFRKPKVQVIEHEETGIVEVKDLKQYLVGEYDKVRLLEQQNQTLRDELDKVGEVRKELNVLKVILEQKDNTITRLERDVRDGKDAAKQARLDRDDAKEQANDLRIKLENTQPIPIAQRVVEFCIDSIEEIATNKSGNVSKNEVVHILQDIVIDNEALDIACSDE